MVYAHAIFNSTGGGLAAGGVGFVLAAVGLALALDFKGATTRHVAMTFRMMAQMEGSLRRVPPWRRLLQRSMKDRQRSQVKLERLIGAAFAVVGLGLCLMALVGLVRGLLS